MKNKCFPRYSNRDSKLIALADMKKNNVDIGLLWKEKNILMISSTADRDIVRIKHSS